MSADEVALSRIQKLNVTLTDRDRLILSTLATHRMLTTPQIAELAFDSPVTARHRMQHLEALQAVHRFRPRADRGSYPSHFVLAPAGAAVVAKDADQETKPAIRQARRDRELGLKSPSGLRHLLGVNGFHTALEAHARTHSDTEVERWLSEREMPEPGVYSHRVRPDAVLTWREGDARSTLALEYDTGTERLARLVDKIDRYATLLSLDPRTADGWEADELFGHERPLVLFVFASAGRETQARTALRRTPTAVPIATGVWTSGTSPAEALWLPLNARPPRVRLAQLVAVASAPAALAPIETGTTRTPGRTGSAAPSAADAWFEDDDVEPW
ncbi:replication-relaxation family protein [Embleya sp. NPDC050493]|uniref:replication-relaxation family protein n=1 Tax=Embleya sp. NPDC050493 TaxID=3363989 RepID=UPI00379B0A95